MSFQVQQSSNRGVGFFLLASGLFPLFLTGFMVANGIVTDSWSKMILPLVCSGTLFILVTGFGAGMLCYGAFVRKTLLVDEVKIQFLKGSQVLGQIPMTNLVEIKVLREADQNYAAVGGALGGLAYALAEKRKAEGNGLAFVIDDSDDKHTFWPGSWQRHRFEYHLTTPMQMTYQAIHDALQPLLPTKAAKPKSAAPENWSPPVSGNAKPTVAPKPESEPNPFDFN